MEAAAAAAAWAGGSGLRVGVVVLDARFVPVAALTMDGAYASVFEVARAKAHTALNFGASSADLAARIKPENRRALAAVEPRLMIVGGGVPIAVAGRLLGAIGVSGGSEDQDVACAEHARRAVDWESG